MFGYKIQDGGVLPLTVNNCSDADADNGTG